MALRRASSLASAASSSTMSTTASVRTLAARVPVKVARRLRKSGGEGMWRLAQRRTIVSSVRASECSARMLTSSAASASAAYAPKMAEMAPASAELPNVPVYVPDQSRFKHMTQNVGIKYIDAYFPRYYVDQAELEQHDKVGQGKYTIGLGQTTMAFCTDREDIYSMALTAVANAIEKAGISYADIGRLEVATETIMDHSKSIKTYLMQLFAMSGNNDVEGVDSMNACYAGTNALFNTVAWMESSAWDGRYGVVVAGDIAEYEPGNARPTGGAGVCVMIVGPDAPLVVDQGARASYMEHAYDFYKPNLLSPYPVVDGKGSQVCYLRALDSCYRLYAEKQRVMTGKSISLNDFNSVLFHAPYNKLVRQSLGRMLFNDFKTGHWQEELAESEASELKEFAEMDPVATYSSAALVKKFTGLTEKNGIYAAKTETSTLLPRMLGNSYTGSLYCGLLSLVGQQGAKLAGTKNLLFSYGSGLAASLFSVSGRATPEAKDELDAMAKLTDLKTRLADRIRKSPEEFNAHLQIREDLHHKKAFQPQSSTDDLWPGTFYLTERDALGRRFYARK